MWKWIIGILCCVAVVVVILFLVGVFKLMYYSIPYDKWVEIEKERAKDEAKKARKKAERGKKHGRNSD